MQTILNKLMSLEKKNTISSSIVHLPILTNLIPYVQYLCVFAQTQYDFLQVFIYQQPVGFLEEQQSVGYANWGWSQF